MMRLAHSTLLIHPDDFFPEYFCIWKQLVHIHAIAIGCRFLFYFDKSYMYHSFCCSCIRIKRITATLPLIFCRCHSATEDVTQDTKKTRTRNVFSRNEKNIKTATTNDNTKIIISKKWLEQVQHIQCSAQKEEKQKKKQLPWLWTNILWFTKLCVRIKFRSRPHLTLNCWMCTIFRARAQSRIFHTIFKSNRIASLPTPPPNGSSADRHSMLQLIHCIVVPYRIIGRCESILHRHCERFNKMS